MKYRFEHEFPCDRKTLIRAMFEQGVSEKLLPRMKNMVDAKTLAWEEHDGRIVRRVLYKPVPMIQSVGPKKVDPRWMEWVEESEADLGRTTAKYRNVPTTKGVADLLKNHGEVEFVELGPNRTRRVLSGELKVEVFLLGAVAERVIHANAKNIVDEEAAALAGYLRDGK
jgi:hypothetical protein